MRSPHHFLRTARADAGRLVLLALLTALLWGWHHDRLTLASWSQPLGYAGDSLEILTELKAAGEGDLAPVQSHRVRRLGAPFGADWNEYPGSDDVANWVFGQLGRLLGVAAASNVALLLAQLLATAAFYGCARLLRHRWEWAAAGALLFSFSYFSLSRSLPHFWLTFTYTVPLALLSCGLVAAGRRTLHRPAWRWLAYGTAGLLGVSNPYQLFLYLQLLAWSVLAQWVRRGWSAGVRLGGGCGILALLLFALTHAYLWLDAPDHGETPLLVRNYAGTEIYGLKPIELVMPSSQHHSAWLAAMGSRYLRWTDWRGETFSPYLGMVGAAALAWLLVAAARSQWAPRRRCPGPVLPALWILLFSAIGGINSILAFFIGLNVFRAANRNSIFLLALVLFFLVARLSRLSRRWAPALRLAVAGAVTIFGLWDQIPRAAAPEAAAAIARRVAADRRFGTELEQRLGAGAMVFQLPILEFPEGRAQLGVNEYDHLRPFLATRTLRFSYGDGKNRASAAWQRDCLNLAPAELVRKLESAGFAALAIDRGGFADGGAALLAGLAAAGRTETWDAPDHEQVVVRLRPSAPSRPPLAQSLTFGRGWNPPANGEERDGLRWTNGSASLSYFNPEARPLPAALRLDATGVDGRSLRVLVNGREQFRGALQNRPVEVATARFELAPGINRIDLATPEPAVRVSEQRWRLRAIGVRRLQLRVQSAAGEFVVGEGAPLPGAPNSDDSAAPGAPAP